MDDERPETSNPYAAPVGAAAHDERKANGKVMAPAIALLVIGLLGIVVSLFNLVFALLTPNQAIDPNAPEIIQEMQRNAGGPLAAAVQAVFAIVNGLIILGAIYMMRLRSWGWAMTSSVLAMVNIGTCCCVMGFPVGIWAIIVLSMEDVKQMFASARENLDSAQMDFNPYRQ
jgi:hypothetical protein